VDGILKLLELASAGKNQALLTRKPVQLREVLQDAITATKRDAYSAGCSVELTIPAALRELSGDGAALRRVFQNLLTGAARHSGTCVQVRDAVGSSPHPLPHTWRIFSQVHPKAVSGRNSSLLKSAPTTAGMPTASDWK
jgi:signal transduction histidine kinase